MMEIAVRFVGALIFVPSMWLVINCYRLLTNDEYYSLFGEFGALDDFIHSI